MFRLSFGGSGVQARAVMDGLPADIVALALPLDMDKIAQAGLMPRVRGAEVRDVCVVYVYVMYLCWEDFYRVKPRTEAQTYFRVPPPPRALRQDWSKRFPNNSVITESTVALVLREGNPKNVKGWADLTR